MQTTLQRLIEFCNKHANQQFTRQDMLKAMFFSQSTDATIDSYRRYLTRAGFLEHVKPGIYFVKKCIPNMTSDDLRHLCNYKVSKHTRRHDLLHDIEMTKL